MATNLVSKEVIQEILNKIAESINEKADTSHIHTISEIANLETTLNNKAPAYTYGMTDMTAGTSSLATGTLYFVYE